MDNFKVNKHLPGVTECEGHSQVMATDEHAAIQSDFHDGVALHGTTYTDEAVHWVTVGTAGCGSHL